MSEERTPYTKTARIYCRKQIIEDVPVNRDAVLIGIETPGANYETGMNWSEWPTYVRVEFEDFEHDHTAKAEGKRQYKVIDDWHASKMIQAMSENLNKDFYIFCDGGISRSMAVGVFMRDFLEYELELNAYQVTDHMNKLVYARLGAAFSKRFWVVLHPKLHKDMVGRR